MRGKYRYLCLVLLVFVLSGTMPVYAEETEQMETEAETGRETELETETESETETEPETESEQSDFEIDGTILTAYYGSDAEVIIPEGVTEITPWCFDESQTIYKVVLPETIRVVGSCAFYNTSLKEVVLPEGLEVIGEFAFYCEGLSRVCIPRSVREIGDYAFNGDVYLDCYKGSAGFAYAKNYHANNSMVLDAEKKLSDLKITLSQTELVCSGNAVRPEIEIMDGETMLKEGTDYVVQYGENIQPGVYAVTVQALLSEIYMGNATFTYTVRPRTVRHLVSGLETSSDKAVLQWIQSFGATGYEISRYDSSTKKWSLVERISETSFIDIGLQPDTTYEYRVRAYAFVDGQDIYGDYSSVLTVRTLPTNESIKKTNKSVKKGAGASVTSVKTKLGVTLDTSSLGWENWSHVSDVTEFLDGKGAYCIAYTKGKYLYINKYTSSKRLKLTQTLKIKKKYPLTGGVACDTDSNYYIVWGKNDDKGAGNVDTIAVSKYNPEGKHVKTTKYYTEKNALEKESWDTRYPFDAGNCVIAIKGNLLICSYGREMYNGHQSNNVISVDTTTMEKVTRFSNYVSHSFNQSVLISKDDEAVFTNQGDAYPRGIETAKERLSDPSDQERDIAEEESPNTGNVSFHFYGDIGDNWTGAQHGGIAEVSSGYFLAAAGPKSMTEKAHSETRNVFVQLLSKSNLESMLKGSSRSGTSGGEAAEDKGILWLTNYSNKYTANAVSVTATDDDRVIVMWEKATVGGGFLNSYYVILSANGRILQNVTGLGGRRLNIYEAPVYRKGYLYWTSAEGGTQKVKTYCMKVNGVSVPKSIEKVEGLTYEKEWEKWPDPIVVLKWERADDAEGYEVYRSVSRNKNYKKVKEIKSAGVLSWSDKKALKGTTYYYKVRAFRNINGEKLTGKYSQPLKVTVDWP